MRMASNLTSAGSVAVARSEFHRAGGGSIPTSALQQLRLGAVTSRLAKAFIARHHYLGKPAGGTSILIGVLLGDRLVGIVTFGAGPSQAFCLVDGAKRPDCLCLSRFCLVDDLPKNAATRILGVILGALRRETSLKFVISYADPAQGHVGTIYQASNWLYTGLSEPTPRYDLGDGVLRHSRSLGNAYGSRSVKHFQTHGVPIRTVRQTPKHRYLYFLDPAWRTRLRVPVQPFPKREKQVEENER